jgi:uncharacterized protein
MPAGLPPLISFPFDGVGPDGRLAWTTGNESVREVMQNILLTRPGERLMRPAFGAGLRSFVHQPNNETTRALISDAARRAIERWETRVSVEEVTVLPDRERLSHVNLTIHYRLRQDGTGAELALAIDLGSAS